MEQKRCFKCRKTKPLNEFYTHTEMADGHLNKCKTCTKRDVKRRYYDPRFIDRIRIYEKFRNTTPERKQNRKVYERRRRLNNPGKARCSQWINNAVRDGRIKRLPCEVCGNLKSQGHHDDYRKPQQVRWLCFKHHREIAHGQLVVKL
jgi:hypothetical protein